MLPHPFTDFLWSELLLDCRDRPEVSERVRGHTESVAPERVFGWHDGSDVGVHRTFIRSVYVVDIDLQGDAGSSQGLRRTETRQLRKGANFRSLPSEFVPVFRWELRGFDLLGFLRLERF